MVAVGIGGFGGAPRVSPVLEAMKVLPVRDVGRGSFDVDVDRQTVTLDREPRIAHRLVPRGFGVHGTQLGQIDALAGRCGLSVGDRGENSGERSADEGADDGAAGNRAAGNRADGRGTPIGRGGAAPGSLSRGGWNVRHFAPLLKIGSPRAYLQDSPAASLP
jgi:hypothetical protein